MPKTAVKDVGELPAILTMDQVRQLLGISRPMAYQLAHRKGFPVVRFGRTLRVPKEALVKWLERQAGEVDLDG
jgi:excisionase family DNA binding protein